MSTIEIQEKGLKYVQNYDVVLVLLLLTLNMFHTFSIDSIVNFPK